MEKKVRIPVVAFDPGQEGAMAAFSGVGDLKVVESLPLDGEGLPDVKRIEEFIRRNNCGVAVIEAVGGLGKQSASRSFKFGRNAGRLDAVCRMVCVEVVYFTPQTWKGSMGLIGQDKAASRALASKLYPEFADAFKRVKDDGRAEAVLIGRVFLKKSEVI